MIKPGTIRDDMLFTTKGIWVPHINIEPKPKEWVYNKIIDKFPLRGKIFYTMVPDDNNFKNFKKKWKEFLPGKSITDPIVISKFEDCVFYRRRRNKDFIAWKTRRKKLKSEKFKSNVLPTGFVSAGNYIRLVEKFPLSKIHEIYSDNDKTIYFENNIYNNIIFHTKSLRYENLIKHGAKCTHHNCSFEATHAYLETTMSIKKFSHAVTVGSPIKMHFNIYGVDEHNNEIMLTKDHIVPASLGGPDKIWNMQPMCSRCNRKKDKQIINYRRKIAA